MSQTAERYLPGISRFPALARQFTERLARAGCCDTNRVVEAYRGKLEARLRRDRWLRGG